MRPLGSACGTPDRQVLFLGPRPAVRMKASATIKSVGVVGLTLSVGLAGCSLLSAAPGGKPGPVREVNLKVSPTPGMRVAYQVRTVATLSGAGVSSLPESQRSASVSQRYVLEVTAVEGDSFDVRITGDGLQGAVTARFGRDWTALKFGVESQGRYVDADLATFPVLGEAFQVARALSGPWGVGETRPWERTVNAPPLLRVRMQGTATLKRITRLDGRPAAEFHYGASGEGEYAGSRLRMSLSGQSWTDLATGFILEVKTSAPGAFSQSGKPVQLEIKEERTLNRRDSTGF